MDHYRNTVPKHGARSPDPAMENVSQQLGQSGQPHKLLVAEWKTPNLREKLNDKQLYVASDDTCLHITNDRLAEVAGLQSNQEEADTRILLHAAHAAAEGYRSVVVTADDSDVMVLCPVPEIRNKESG